MYLNSLKLTGWRNYSGQLLDLSPGINLLFGKNGQGKTNLLEAVYFLSCGHTPRAGKVEELINWYSAYFFLQGIFQLKDGTVKVEMGTARDGRKSIKINGSPVHRLGELSGINSVLFIPEDLYLVKGGPDLRRKFLDLEISQLNKNYRALIAEYKRFLRERNALLKQKHGDKILLEVLTEKLAKLSIPITQIRKSNLDKLSILTRLNHRKLTETKDKFSLEYKWTVDPQANYEDVIKDFNNQYDNEKKHGYTMIGPHRDDFSFSLNDVDLRTFGSQGQQRTAVLALKLAEIELFKAETGEYPILLLDDVFSELDSKRKSKLLEFLSGRIQSLISSAEEIKVSPSTNIFYVSEGTIKEGKEGK